MPIPNTLKEFRDRPFCVEIRDIPKECKHRDLKEFLEQKADVKPLEIKFVGDNAYVTLQFRSDQDNLHRKEGIEFMGSRFKNINDIEYSEYCHIVKYHRHSKRVMIVDFDFRFRFDRVHRDFDPKEEIPHENIQILFDGQAKSMGIVLLTFSDEVKARSFVRKHRHNRKEKVYQISEDLYTEMLDSQLDHTFNFKGLIKLTGLGDTTTPEDVQEFFKSYELAPESSVHFMRNKSDFRLSGNALIVFASETEAIDALNEKKKSVEDHFRSGVRIYLATKGDLIRSLGDAVREDSNDEDILLLKGLPFDANIDDVMRFFRDKDLKKEDICLMEGADKKPNGDCFVFMSGKDDALDTAQEYNKKKMGSRWIEVIPTRRGEYYFTRWIVGRQQEDYDRTGFLPRPRGGAPRRKSPMRRGRRSRSRENRGTRNRRRPSPPSRGDRRRDSSVRRSSRSPPPPSKRRNRSPSKSRYDDKPIVRNAKGQIVRDAKNTNKNRSRSRSRERR